MMSVTELTGMEGEIVSMQEIFRFKRTGLDENNMILGHFTATGLRSIHSDRFKQWGYELPNSIYTPVKTD